MSNGDSTVRTRATVWIVATSFLLAALLALPGPGAPRAGAAIPSPPPGSAVVSVYVGGDRSTPTTIAPLPGAVFGLFGAEPAGFDPDVGFTTSPPLHTCTSDADGHCVFVLPIGSEGTAPGSRLWVAPVAPPPGSGTQWFANPVWQTAPLLGSPRDQTRHVFQTPPLYAEQSYISGSNGFIGEPGTQTSPPDPTPEYTRRIDSGGVWPLSREDPPVIQQCGHNAALVVDLSSSMNGSVPALKEAMDAFVNSLRGTPSRAALYTFSTNTPAVAAGPNSPLLPVATTGDANAFRQLYASWTNAQANGYTNWDAALAAVAASNQSLPPADRFDLTVFLTDGNPTVYSQVVGPVPSRSGYTRFREIGNAVASANLLKASGGSLAGTTLLGGTRVLAVGVGSGLDAGADLNLRSISGRTPLGPGTPISEVDYFRADDFTEVGARLRELFLSACAPSVTVIKQIVPFGGDIEDAYTPTDSWDFTATPTTPDVTVDPAAASTNPTTGALNFDLEFDEDAAPAGVDIAEDPRTAEGYTPFPVDGDNAVCVNKSEDDAPVPVDDVGTDGFHVDVGTLDAISCTVYNQAPDVNAASVVLTKSWRVFTEVGVIEYQEGTQPFDAQSSSSLTGPESLGPSEQPWDLERLGYRAGDAVDFSESVQLGVPDCDFRGGTITGPGVVDTELEPDDPTAQMVLDPGLNEYHVTNDIRCFSHLTLLKRVEGGPADPFSWTLTATQPGGGLPGPSGVSGATSEVTPELNYQLSEEPQAGDPSLLNYAQDDLRRLPLVNPQSTGSMSCDVTDGSGSGNATGSEGGVEVPRGQHVTCTAINRTSTLRIVKQVSGGSAPPSAFRFTISPIAPDPPGVPVQTVTAAPRPGQEVNVRPGQRYRVEEAAGADGYVLEGISCSLDGSPVPSDGLALPAGAEAVCVATNRFDAGPGPGPEPPTGPGPEPPGENGQGKKKRGGVAVSKRADRRRARPGQRIAYRIVLRSRGPGPARSVRLCDPVPSPLVLRRAPGGRARGGKVCWSVGKLARGARRVFRVTASVPRIGSSRTSCNVARATGSNLEARRDEACVRLLSPRPEPPQFTG